jgi:hypothetical protein
VSLRPSRPASPRYVERPWGAVCTCTARATLASRCTRQAKARQGSRTTRPKALSNERATRAPRQRGRPDGVVMRGGGFPPGRAGRNGAADDRRRWSGPDSRVRRALANHGVVHRGSPCSGAYLRHSAARHAPVWDLRPPRWAESLALHPTGPLRMHHGRRQCSAIVPARRRDARRRAVRRGSAAAAYPLRDEIQRAPWLLDGSLPLLAHTVAVGARRYWAQPRRRDMTAAATSPSHRLRGGWAPAGPLRPAAPTSTPAGRDRRARVTRLPRA